MMKPLSSLFSSFAVTLVISFVFPVILVLSLLALTLGMSYFPGLDCFGEVSFHQLVTFLSIFGAGSVSRGVIVIGLTLALVAGWFDLYTLYRHYQFQSGKSVRIDDSPNKR